MKISYSFLRVLLALLFLGNAFSTVAQDQQKKTVTGTIKDAKGEPMPFVNVIIKGTTTSAATDIDGKFSIQASSEDVLVVSFVSYKTQEIKVGAQSSVDITMEEDVKVLDEVVAVGYGQMKRTDLSSAQVSISSKEIERTVNTSLEQAIQGRAAGVQVTQNSGQPGGGISVNIRGMSTLNGTTQPLYVIDGVWIQPNVGGDGTTSSTNPMAGINPSDIESMEILQGPSATAVYGSRAANGVILITTKRGKSGKMQVQYNLTYSVQQTPKELSTLNLQQYATMYNAYSDMGGITPNGDFANPSLLGAGTNWQSAIFKTAPLMKHQLSISGGDQKTQYYLSGEYFKQDGVAIGSGFDRYSIRLNLDNQTYKWMKISANVMASQTHDKVTSSADNLIYTAISQSPAVPVTTPDGSFGSVDNSASYMAPNPVGLATVNDRNYTRNNLLGGLTAELNLFKGLVFRTSFSGTYTNSMNYNWEPSFTFGSYSRSTSTSSRSYGNNYSYVFNQLLQYNRKINKHDFGIMATHESQFYSSDNVSASAYDYVNNSITELQAGSENYNPSSYRGTGSWESYLGRINYTYNNIYILQAAMRADGSSNFGANNRWAFFNSASGAIRFSEMAFLKDIKNISDLKLRLEIGTAGNAGGLSGQNYALLNTIQTAYGVGYLAGNYPNPNLKWESTTTINAGVNISLFQNRLEFIGDVYLKNTSDLLVSRPVPAYLGAGTGPGQFSYPYVNLGAVRNTGVAFTVNAVPVEKPFLWRVSANMSVNKNKLTSLNTGSDYLYRSYQFISNNFQIQRSTVGDAIWQFYAYEYNGLIQNSTQLNDPATPIPVEAGGRKEVGRTYVGDVLYKDLNGDTLISTSDVAKIGNPWPAFTFGLTNTFEYKGLELSVLLQGSVGNDVYNYTKFIYSNPSGTSGKLASTFNYAKLSTIQDGNGDDYTYVTNPETDIPRMVTSDNNGNFTKLTDKYLENGSYLRLKNITLSYNLPKTILEKYTKGYVNNVKLSVGAQNLFTITSYTGYDPEIGAYIGSGASGNATVYGVDYGRYPSVRTYTFNLIVGF